MKKLNYVADLERQIAETTESIKVRLGLRNFGSALV